MKRIAINTGEGYWFDGDKADFYAEKSNFNGSNWISLATGSQWNHEGIFITKSGKFILNTYSDYQGTVDKYVLISKEDAATWFCRQSFTDEEIPDIFKAEVKLLEIV